MRGRVGAIVVLLALLPGCAAHVGQTDLTLHQRAVFADGSRLELGPITLSEVDNPDPDGPTKIPGKEVAVAVLVENEGPSIALADVAVSLSYRGDQGRDVTPRALAGRGKLVVVGKKVTVTTTYQIENNVEVFRTHYIRVRVERAGYPGVTFSGSNP